MLFCAKIKPETLYMNNLVLRRLRYALNLRETTMAEIFKLADHKMSPSEITHLLKRDTEAGFVECSASQMSLFLDGLIIKLRGVREGAPAPAKDATINNNLILKKIRIALELREEDLLEIMLLADFKFSKSELSAFFRKPGSRQYKPCGDQMLRNFLMGLCQKNRPSEKEEK